MKKIITVIIALYIAAPLNAQVPDSWTEKNGLGLNVPASTLMHQRMRAVSFSIGAHGYVGTGFDGAIFYNDFWQYDPSTNVWTQKANFGGSAREAAIAFSIGNNGYIGTGSDGNNKNDFWEYNSLTNVWTPKSNFGGTARTYAVAFSVSGKGYVGTGYDAPTGYKNDFWEYDPVTDIWTQKADFGGTRRFKAVGFGIGSKGYIGTGTNGSFPRYKDFWEYNPASDTWLQKADFGGVGREAATGFSIGSKGYIGTGFTAAYVKDFWQYNPATDSWTQKTDFGGTPRYFSCSFNIGSKAYIGTGWLSGYKNDWWEYDTTTNVWNEKSPDGRDFAACFVIGNKGYIGTGYFGINENDFWEFDLSANTWIKKANFSGGARLYASGFSIGNKGYFGNGFDGTSRKKDFWEYNPINNAWTQKADGLTINSSVSFSIGCKGYFGIGTDSSGFSTKLREYDPVSNTWTQKANFGGIPRTGGTGFSIGNKGYIGLGYNGTYKNDFWEYDPVSDSWTQKADFGGIAREWAAGFSIGNKGYIGTGYNGGASYNDFWEFDQATNTWTQRANFSGAVRNGAIGFCAGNKGYMGTGLNSSFLNDFWEYTPICTTPISTIYSSGNISFCSSDSVFLYANYGYSYQWKKNGVIITGATSYFYYATTAGSYTCYLSNSCGAVTSGATTVTVNPLPSATITPAGPTTFCSGGSVVLNAVVAANRTYQWKKGANLISGATLSSYTATTGGNYKVIVTNTVTGCSKTTASATVVTVNALPSATITPQGPTTFCAGGSVVLQANTGAGLTYKWKKGSNFISGATLSNYTATTGGNYKVQVTNSNGCSKTSAGVTVTVPCRDGEIVSENSFDVNVFPNPSSGDFTFEFKNISEEKISIHIYDVMGKLVLSESIHNSAFSIHNSKLTPGIYSAVITNGENEKVLKLVKANQ